MSYFISNRTIQEVAKILTLVEEVSKSTLKAEFNHLQVTHIDKNEVLGWVVLTDKGVELELALPEIEVEMEEKEVHKIHNTIITS